MENLIKGNQFKAVINDQNDEDYQNKLKEVEMEKQAKLKEYREYLLKMKKEKEKIKRKKFWVLKNWQKLKVKRD